MSCDYYMACNSCKSCINFASDGLSGFKFFRNEPGCMEVLHAWFHDHALCSPMPRMTTEYEVVDGDGWTEVEWK